MESMSKRLSKDEIQKIIDDWNNGIEHPDYKVVKNNMGTVVRRRRYNKKNSTGDAATEPAPATKTEVKEPVKDKSWMRDIQYYNLNSTINMMSQSIKDLNERLTEYKNKQVKLKGKYKALKKAIYEDDDDESVDVETATRTAARPCGAAEPVDEPAPCQAAEPPSEPVEEPVSERVDEPVSEPAGVAATEPADEPVQPQQYMPQQYMPQQYMKRSRRFNFGSYF